ncbi:MAG: 1-deoxy-D-xylulose-5-phosphate synthase [Phycisphaerae bacterium]|nr:1-deoxy-D-xylulose-5-phosphate synthase [Phycisphaerae bacterium]
MDFSHLKLTHLPRLNTPADLRRLPISALPEVAAEIRRAICDQISRSGGHLAPNLGVVELTIALHYVFDFGHDRLLFDVGHQCYPHKLLTGRLPLLGKLRLRDGMAGFPEPRESPYDLFSVGHAGTGISTAVGMARGDSLNGEGWSPENPSGRRIATIIGDASIVNGVAMEGLNNAGTLKRQFLVVLNDNGMSIAKPQGAVAAYFDKVRLSHSYGEFKKAAKEMLAKMPGGDLMREAYHRMGEASKALVSEDAWFEHFGLLTVGPVDGHDIPTLIQVLNEAKDTDRPLVLHVKTIKGKGYSFAEGDSTTFHSPSPFSISDMESEGCRVELKKSSRSFTGAFGEMLADLMARDPKVVACTAAMPDGTGLSKVMPKFPDRTWDTGICESHALDMMAGLAKTGWKPFFAVYSTFLQRAFDQCFQEVSLQGLAVRLCLDRAGLVGGDGAVHHGFCDVSILRCLPKACLMAAIDEPSLKASLEFMRFYDEGLSSVRYPRDSVSQRFVDEPCPPFELGKARTLLENDRPHVAVLAFGTPAIDACEAADMLAGEYRVNVYDARFAKPVDIGLVRSLIDRGIPIITVEDHSIEGGFGSCVLDACNDEKLDTRLITRLALPDSWIYQGERKEQLAEAGLDAAGIARAIRAAVDAHGLTPGSNTPGKPESVVSGRS